MYAYKKLSLGQIATAMVAMFHHYLLVCDNFFHITDSANTSSLRFYFKCYFVVIPPCSSYELVFHLHNRYKSEISIADVSWKILAS